MKGYNGSKWLDVFIIRAYELSRDGLTEYQMAKCLGISKPTFILWERKKILFRTAIKMGRAYRVALHRGVYDMTDYIYHRLPKNLQVLWQQIDSFDRAGAGIEKVEALLEKKGKHIRQSIFLCAMVNGNFSIAAACRKTGIPRITFELWKSDPDFQQLVNEIQEVKKDWAQNCLHRLVTMGDSPATIYLNRCYNKDRGLDDRQPIQVEVSGAIQHNHTHTIVAVEDLDLPLNIQKLILDRVRQKKLVESTVVGKSVEDEEE
jgi:DNA-binding XRE family transcriptional regulator